MIVNWSNSKEAYPVPGYGSVTRYALVAMPAPE